jgi:hypothetical protein
MQHAVDGDPSWSMIADVFPTAAMTDAALLAAFADATVAAQPHQLPPGFTAQQHFQQLWAVSKLPKSRQYAGMSSGCIDACAVRPPAACQLPSHTPPACTQSPTAPPVSGVPLLPAGVISGGQRRTAAHANRDGLYLSPMEEFMAVASASGLPWREVIGQRPEWAEAYGQVEEQHRAGKWESPARDT